MDNLQENRFRDEMKVREEIRKLQCSIDKRLEHGALMRAKILKSMQLILTAIIILGGLSVAIQIKVFNALTSPISCGGEYE